MEAVVTIDPAIMHGTPCFAGTRVAVQTLFDFLEDGYSIDEFLAEFVTVGRERVDRLLHDAQSISRQPAEPRDPDAAPPT